MTLGRYIKCGISTISEYIFMDEHQIPIIQQILNVLPYDQNQQNDAITCICWFLFILCKHTFKGSDINSQKVKNA